MKSQGLNPLNTPLLIRVLYFHNHLPLSRARSFNTNDHIEILRFIHFSRKHLQIL